MGSSNTTAQLHGSIYETTAKYSNSVLITSSGFVNDTSHGVVRARLSKQLPSGPYFISPYTGAIFKAHRMYADPYLGFTEPAVSDEEGGFFPLPVTTEVYQFALSGKIKAKFLLEPHAEKCRSTIQALLHTS